MKKKIKSLKTTGNHFMKRDVVLKFWPVPILFFLVYIPVSFFISKDYFSGWTLCITFLFLLISLLVYSKTKDVLLITNLLTSLGIPVLIPWLITGGPSGNGVSWSIVYVVWAFFVATKKSAIFWLSIYLILSIIIVVFSQNHLLKIAYSIAELINLFFAFVITFVLVYLFNNIREHYYQLSKKREEELIQVNENLISVNNELEQFTYAASHDLQEPLRMVSNFLQLLEKRYKDKLDKDANEFIGYAVDGSEKMRSIILSLLDYTQTNKVRAFERIDVNDLLKVVLKDLSSQIKKNKAEITIEPLPVIFGDKLLINQLFQNLISNAVKFKGEKNPKIFISGKKENNEFIFSVKDNGIGIQKEYADKLFTIFQHLNSKEKYPGTGIGLAMCKKIVEKHGGKIWFESEFGKGTTFYFTIKETIENPQVRKKERSKQFLNSFSI